ncbi:efflux pump [Hyaloscypha variabilis F]|uniref:Efflux pump n=1 Tax=Hyaloscypha variabilis (strain UAMH 11265 / GT02V1 / F) TaxID=1149755 RepID=A0A2J6RTS9_HYAVF|nr:efflux pump [Hyaloscypha variabilis F]
MSISSDLQNPPDVSTDVTEAAAAAPAEAEFEYVTGVKLWLATAAVTLVCFLMMLDMSIIVTAIPRITTDFHSLGDVGWYGSAYLLSNCALQPSTGKIYSNFGSKNTFIAFLGLFEIGSTICGAARSSNMLIVGRAVAGLGASGLTNGALTIIGAIAPMHKRPALMGIMMAIGQLGIVGGPLLGGALTEYVTWRWCFYINLPIGGASALLLFLIHIPDRLDMSKAEKNTARELLSKLDIGGFCLFAPCAIMFLMALEWGGTKYAWNSAKVIGLLCGSAGTFAIFVVWEFRQGDNAMIPYSMLRKKEVWSSCIVIFFFFGGLLTFTYYLPIYFQAVKGVAPSPSGVYILPGILSQMMMAVVSGVLVGKLGYYLPWIASSGVIVAIAAGLISTFTPHTPTATWVGYQFLAGIGRGCGMAIPIVAIQSVVTPAQIPVAMSLIAFSQTFGGTLFLTFDQTIFSRSLVDGLKRFAPTVDAQAVIAAGASGIRQVVKPDQVEGVVLAYNLGINRNFYLAAGASVGTFVFSWGMGWHSVKKKKVVAPEA